MNSDNFWDKTIWDPSNPEQAIEDPLHGPTAMQQLLRTPPMPLGNGTYLRPGRYYMDGTSYEDWDEKPVLNIGARSTENLSRELQDLTEWVEHSRLGEVVLTALEAERQRKRIHKIGYASCFKVDDVCPGGEKLQDCPSGRKAYQAGKKYNNGFPKNGYSETYVVIPNDSCAKCQLSCNVAVLAENGEPTGVRVNFYNEAPDNTQVIELDSARLITSKTKLKVVKAKLQNIETDQTPEES